MTQDEMVTQVAHMIEFERLSDEQMRQIQGAIAKNKNKKQCREYFAPTTTNIPYVHIRTKVDSEGIM